MIRRKCLSLALALCLALALLPGTAAAAGTPTFADVQEGDWFVEDVAYVYEHGLMDGTGEGMFSPDGKATRAMVVTILYRLAGEPAVTGRSPFQDVRAADWFAPAVTWAASRGIANGTSETAFSPNGIITREQLAAFLYRYASTSGWDTSARANLNQFQDQRLISPYAHTAVSWACGERLLTGSSHSSGLYLAPTSIAPRDQLAAVLHRFCQQVSPTPPPATGEHFVVAPDAAAIFEQMPQSFVFSSGAGGWATQLTIQTDGTFEGFYYDSNLGDTGPGYPNGSAYFCLFQGKFQDVVQINPWEYRMYLEYLTYPIFPGQVYYQDGIRYIASDTPPYGLTNPKEFRLYLPGHPTGNLPQAYLDWVSMPNVWWNSVPSTLPFWGLYNVGGAQGYFGVEADPEPDPDPEPVTQPWKVPYRAVIQSDIQFTAISSGVSLTTLQEDARYYFFDANEDAIPELYITYSSVRPGGRIFVYRDENAYYYTASHNTLLYIPGTGLILDPGIHTDGFYDVLYRLQGSDLRLLGRNNYGNGSSKWNGENVSQDVYERNLAATFDADRAVDLRAEGTPLTYQEVLSYLAP